MSRPLLSVNVNKYALLRNSRGRDVPNLCWAIDLCLASGAHGITIHPRLDERHIRLADVPVVAAHLRAHHPGVELNIECENDPRLIELDGITITAGSPCARAAAATPCAWLPLE